MLPVPALLWTKTGRSLTGVALVLACLALGPLLALFTEQAPVLDADQDLITPWLALLATAAASLAVWGLQDLTFARRLQPWPVLADALAATTLVLVALALAWASLALAGIHADVLHIPLEALRMGCLAALVATVLPSSPRLAPALVWIPAWLLPALVHHPSAQLLSPYGGGPLTALTSSLGLLLLAHATSPHALRDPR